MKKHEIISISPAIVDIACDLTTKEKIYLELCQILDSKPGEWKPVDSQKEIESLLGLVAGVTNFSIENDLDLLTQTVGVNMEAGSSGLNLLSALIRTQRENSAILSAVGSDSVGHPDNLASFFGRDARKIGIYQYSIPQQGSTPLVLVFSHREQPDKVTAMHPGVASQIESLPNGISKSRIVRIDAYDLLRDPASTSLNQLMSSGKVPISLGLGNSSILTGKLKNDILKHIANGKITYLTGNADEFSSLLDISNLQNLENAIGLNIGRLAPYVLLTMGDKGMLGFKENKPIVQKSFRQAKAINTSGAGDVAAGVFLSGILSGQDFSLTLKEAAYFSSQVVGSLSSRFKNGREKKYISNHANTGN
jgi:sugar/nucleoside kinase (ribokinase family)